MRRKRIDRLGRIFTAGLTPVARAACEAVERRTYLCGLEAHSPADSEGLSVEQLIASGSLRAETPRLTAPGDSQSLGGAVIDWTNKGTVNNPTDNFDAFGANEDIARQIVQRAIDDWERVIVAFNYNSGGNTYSVTISASGSVPNGSLGDNLLQGIEISSGIPTSSRIRLNTDIAWYFDPVPGTSLLPDDSEFSGILNTYAASSAPPGPDLYSVTLHELGHAMGIFVVTGSAAAIEDYLTNTGIADPYDEFSLLLNYNVNGGPIEATFTSRGGGHPLEGNAPPGTVDHPNDLMNSSLPNQRRRLISDLDASILRDAYGMTVVLPSQINNMLANLNTSTRDLILSSDPTTPGDFFQVTRSGGNLVVDVNTYREVLPIAEIDSITINADGAGSQFAIEDLPSFIPMTINAGDGDDSLFVGGGDFDTNILSDIVFFGGDGTDSIYVDDVSDTLGSDTYILGVGSFAKINGGDLFFTTSTERITIDGGTADDVFDVQDVPANLAVTIDGNGGDDTVNVGGDIDTEMRGALFINGGSGTGDSLTLNDGLDAASGDSYTLTGSSFTKSSMGGATISFSTTTIESVLLRANAGGNAITVSGTPAGRSTTVDGAGGNDTVIAGGDFDTGFDGYVSVTGGSGTDRLELDDTADAGNDGYTLYASIGQLTKTSWTQELEFGTFEDVLLEANDGNNTVYLPAVSFSVSVTVDGAGGDDLFRNGDGAAFLDMDNWQGPISLNGGAGTDTLQVDDSADFGAGARSYTFSSTFIDRSGSSTGATYSGFDYTTLLAADSDDDITVTSTFVGFVEINGSAGNDAIHVNSVGNVTAMTVFGGNGDDTIDAGAGNVGGSFFNDNVTLQGNSGVDRVIFLDGSDTPGFDTGVLSQFSLTKGVRTVWHNTFESLLITGSPQPTTYDLDFSSIPVTLNAGAGNDTVRMAAGDLDAFSAGVTVNGGAGVDSLTFDDTADTGADSYSLSSTSLAKGVGNGAFDGANYAQFESVRLDANNSANTITVTSAVSGTRINAGGGADVLQLGSTVASVTLTVDGGAGLDDVRVNPDGIGQANVTFELSQDLSNLEINTTSTATLTAGGAKWVRTSALAINGSGALDLTDNAMIYDYLASSPLSAMGALIGTGFAGGTWTGNGIRSSVAAANPGRGLGFAEAGAIGSPPTFFGQPIDNTTLLVRYTLYGDADLTGTVNIDDFGRLAANFNVASTWSRGDFNYSGTTDIDDFGLLAANFNLGLPNAVPRGGGRPQSEAELPGG